MKWTRVDNVPEQPLYVWTIEASTIQVRSHAIDINKTYRLGAYGNVISGTQNILPMYPNTAFLKGDSIHIYGQHLPYGLFSWGDTRYRIPFIVWIWNTIVSGISVVASVGQVLQTINVSAEATTDNSELGVAYTQVDTREAERDGYMAFTTDKIQRSKYILSAMLREQNASIIISSRLVSSTINQTFRMLLHPRSRVTYKPVLTAYISNQVINTIARSKANIANQKITERLKLSTSLIRPYTEKTVKLTINLQSQLFRIAKLNMNLALREIERTTKLSIHAGEGVVERTLKLLIHPGEGIIERTFKLSVHPIPSIIERTFKLSVHPRPSKLEPVLSYIVTNLARHYHRGTINVSSYVRQNVDKKALVHSSTYQIVKGWNGIHTQIRPTVESMKSHLIRLLKDKTERQKLSLKVLHEITLQKGIIAGLLSHHKQYNQRIFFLLDEINQTIKTVININHIHKEIELVEFNVLPLIAERNLRMFPSAAPLVQQLDVMISVCHTWVLSYLNFVPDEVIQDLDVHISTCSHMIASMLQWHLHGGLISNEGYGNEVIFDLGEVDPIGPIPPVPSRTWEGGYVEDPFKGVGYVPSGDSTGYGSPAAEQWVSNVKMWWDNASVPFTQPDDTE